MRDIHLIQGTGLCTPPHRDPAWIASNMPFTHGNNAYKGIFIPGVHGGVNVLRVRCPNGSVAAARKIRHS